MGKCTKSAGDQLIFFPTVGASCSLSDIKKMQQYIFNYFKSINTLILFIVIKYIFILPSHECLISIKIIINSEITDLSLFTFFLSSVEHKSIQDCIGHVWLYNNKMAAFLHKAGPKCAFQLFQSFFSLSFTWNINKPTRLQRALICEALSRQMWNDL